MDGISNSHQVMWVHVVSRQILTAWNDDPDKVHEEVVPPKVIRLWSAVGQSFMIVIKHACGVVEDVSIDLA